MRIAAIAFIALSIPTFAFAAPQRLNNLVTELVRLDSTARDTPTHVELTNPRPGWIYIGMTNSPDTQTVTLTQGDATTPLVFRPATASHPRECMRWLGTGAFTLSISATESAVGPIVVRTMPETHFVRFPQEPHFPELGTFSWEWLNETVLSSVNTVVGFPKPEIDAHITEWTDTGRKFIGYGGLPHDEGLTGQKAFEHWDTSPGFQDPRTSGMIADEFGGRQNPLYPAWIEGMRLLGEKCKGSTKAFYGYCGGPGMYSRPETRELVNTVLSNGFYMAWERYHHEMPTLDEANALMDSLLGTEMKRWRATFPGCERQLVMVLGIFASTPDLNVEPGVNYKVWMDMQMQYLATNPEFDGLFGVHWWYSGAATEELLRWESALYRHYCIEGQTELLSKSLGWTYLNEHIANTDFQNGLDGWTSDGTAITTGYLERYARAQGRYWQRGAEPDEPSGNNFLLLTRDAQRPNQVTQEINGLVPGKTYTVQAIVGDYADLRIGKADEKKIGASVRVDGAEAIPELSYASIPQRTGLLSPQWPFNDGPIWTNRFRTAFRATAPTATLILSDWSSPTEPGGPAGQQLMFNYIQLEPYFP